jgi:hypothetical protein
MLSSGLHSHMGQELLKGKQMAHQPFDRQGFEPLLLLKDMQAVPLGIQLQGQAMTDQRACDIILLEIDLDHAMSIDLALHMPTMQPIEPSVRINDLRQGTSAGQLREGGAWRLVATGKRLVGSLEMVVLYQVLGRLTSRLQGGRPLVGQAFFPGRLR